MKTGFQTGFQEIKEVREEMQTGFREVREEMREGFREFREEMRRSNQQLLLALVNHSHAEGGQAIFTLPAPAE